jgi:hypothetical protein
VPLKTEWSGTPKNAIGQFSCPVRKLRLIRKGYPQWGMSQELPLPDPKCLVNKDFGDLYIVQNRSGCVCVPEVLRVMYPDIRLKDVFGL